MDPLGFGTTDVGRVREQNEDTIHLDDAHGLYIVADGMGGHLGGKAASSLATHTVREALVTDPHDDTPVPAGADVSDTTVDSSPVDAVRYLLGGAVKMAAAKVYASAARHAHLRGMGTTLTVALWRYPSVLIAHVGDSRAYHWHDGALSQITLDHSFVGEQIRAGLMDPSEERTSQLRNIVTRSVGTDPNVEVDTFEVTVGPSDVLLLCSDGLTGMLDDDEIADVLRDQAIASVPDTLVQLANHRGGDDNVSVICIISDAVRDGD